MISNVFCGRNYGNAILSIFLIKCQNPFTTSVCFLNWTFLTEYLMYLMLPKWGKIQDQRANRVNNLLQYTMKLYDHFHINMTKLQPDRRLCTKYLNCAWNTWVIYPCISHLSSMLFTNAVISLVTTQTFDQIVVW